MSDRPDEKKLMGVLTTALILPVAVCACLGGLFLFTKESPTHGLSLLGLALVLGFFNAAIIKIMRRRLEDGGA